MRMYVSKVDSHLTRDDIFNYKTVFLLPLQFLECLMPNRTQFSRKAMELVRFGAIQSTQRAKAFSNPKIRRELSENLLYWRKRRSTGISGIRSIYEGDIF